MTLQVRPARPPLSRAAERALLLAARDGPGPARDRLVEAFLPQIGNVARMYRGSTGVDRTELMQEGVVGLLRALNRYDATLETPFWAYATWWVRQAMQHVVSELARPVALSDRALRELARVKDAQRTARQAHGREPTITELASETGLTRDHVRTLFAAERRPRRLQEPAGVDGGAETFADRIADPRAEDAFDVVPLRPSADRLPRLLEALTERERRIVRGRYGLDGHEHTLSELAENLGVSAERVRQIEHGALDKLREHLEVGRRGR